jgi:hypothetical protein
MSVGEVPHPQNEKYAGEEPWGKMTNDELRIETYALSPKWCLGEYRPPIRLWHNTGFDVDPRNEHMPGAYDSIRNS